MTQHADQPLRTARQAPLTFHPGGTASAEDRHG